MEEGREEGERATCRMAGLHHQASAGDRPIFEEVGDTNEHLRNSSRSPRKEVFECASHASASAATAIASAAIHGCNRR